MKNAIVLHGYVGEAEYYNVSHPSASNSHWFTWLQKQLLTNDIKTDTPEVPRPFDMDWQSWVREVERFDIGPETILVGHSMGGGFWVRYLTEHPEIRIDKVVLVAPWLNLDHEEDTDFFDFELRPAITGQAKSFAVFVSDNDKRSLLDSADFLRTSLSGVKFVDCHNYGHFCYNDMKTDEFPELLAEITG